MLNPAAPAVRPKWSVDWFDYWLALGTTLPFDVDDFFNSGREASATPGLDELGFAFANAAVNLQFGRFGFGLNVDGQTIDVVGTVPNERGETSNIRAAFLSTHLQLAYQFLDGQRRLAAPRARRHADGTDDVSEGDVHGARAILGAEQLDPSRSIDEIQEDELAVAATSEHATGEPPRGLALRSRLESLRLGPYGSHLVAVRESLRWARHPRRAYRGTSPARRLATCLHDDT